RAGPVDLRTERRRKPVCRKQNLEPRTRSSSFFLFSSNFSFSVNPSYPAAQSIATRVGAHFKAHVADARARGQSDLAEAPPPEAFASLIAAAFWASLRREEGYVPRISLVYLAPDRAVAPLLFGRPLPLDPAALTRLAPAVERPGIHLGVW